MSILKRKEPNIDNLKTQKQKPNKFDKERNEQGQF